MRVPRLHKRLAPSVGLLMAAAALCWAPPAGADVGQQIIRLCAEGRSLRGFPPSAYAKALKEMSATTQEYSSCAQEIRQAQVEAAATPKGAKTGPVGGPLPAAVATTPAEQQALARAASSGSAPVSVGGQEIHPGVVHADIASALSTLPTPVLAMLAFLLACLIAFGGNALRNRVRGGRAD